jgi:hypothetical protein
MGPTGATYIQNGSLMCQFRSGAPLTLDGQNEFHLATGQTEIDATTSSYIILPKPLATRSMAADQGCQLGTEEPLPLVTYTSRKQLQAAHIAQRLLLPFQIHTTQAAALATKPHTPLFAGNPARTRVSGGLSTVNVCSGRGLSSKATTPFI